MNERDILAEDYVGPVAISEYMIYCFEFRSFRHRSVTSHVQDKNNPSFMANGILAPLGVEH